MLSLLILFILLLAFFSGARRGFSMQVVYTIGYILSFMAAQHFYKDLASRLELYIPYPAVTSNSQMVFFDQTFSFRLDEAFYAGVAFLLILFIGGLLTRFIGIFVHSLTYIPILKQVDWLAGGILSLIVAYVMIFLLLSLLTFVPVDIVQKQFSGNSLARFIVEQTPFLTNKIHDLWITNVIN
ncbi:CvpA family protein [Enterococcus hirae]|uniref:CvpA family protein n=1 Tax=Enterococcus hirae TaxID=1354 RepID=UPI000BA85BF7|nr:CvpA family protein [Enterococcus hirae]ASV81740.1 CvpA family protein [Enterococcus hirae]MDD9146199.1 CvpA family protein [Enterococcus hirae]MEB5733673.1 CvpA family protein [Enterococcus hirae]MEC4729532.1 CvpA family protein [Enterococcus hirae]NAA11668.1 CvpA family protein [Enterococcus hirae]